MRIILIPAWQLFFLHFARTWPNTVLIVLRPSNLVGNNFKRLSARNCLAFWPKFYLSPERSHGILISSYRYTPTFARYGVLAVAGGLKRQRDLVNSYSRIDGRSVSMRSQRHVSDLAELLRFPSGQPRRLCVTKNRDFTCTSWPTSPSKRLNLRAFIAARKRDPLRQRFPSRCLGR